MGILAVLILFTIFQLSVTEPTPFVKADGNSDVARIAPSGLSDPRGWGIIANKQYNMRSGCYVNGVSCGDIQIDINRTGIAVRIEVPREFLETVEVEAAGTIAENSLKENDTYFVESNIRNDRYYYSLVDESKHWTYGWKGGDSDGPCYKPNFPIFDPNAPWCLEIWNYLNGTFRTFTPPKFVTFHKLHAPTVAGLYNFTLFVADHTNSIGYPDFVNAWNTTLFVPVTLSPSPATIKGGICYDARNGTKCESLPITHTKAIVYALNSSTGQKVARAYVNQTTGNFTLTGLAPTGLGWGYNLTASAGVFRTSLQNVSFSESNATCPYDPYLHPGCEHGWVPIQLSPNQVTTIPPIHLRPSPVVIGTIRYSDAMYGVETCPNPAVHPYLDRSVSDHPWLLSVGVNVLNITVEAYDDLSSSHVYRYQAVSDDANCGDTFRIITAVGKPYVGLDPYGTEFAGLPPTLLGFHLSVRVWVTGYVQSILPPLPSTDVVNFGDIVMKSGALITGTLMFTASTDPHQPIFQSPHYAETNATGTTTDSLFGGNLVIEAKYKDAAGDFRLAGATVINGTGSDGKTTYASRKNITYAIIGFSELYNRTSSSGRWLCRWSTFPANTVTDYCRDHGIGDPQLSTLDMTVSVAVRGYDQIDSSIYTVYPGKHKQIDFLMVQGGVIKAFAFSAHNRPGTREIQSFRPWIFINRSIPVRARVYFYTSHMAVVGYVDCSMVTGGPCSVAKFTLGVNFAGQNPTLREIWFYGQSPTHLAGDTLGEPYYEVKAFTLGYAQAWPVSTPVDRLDVRIVSVILFIGNALNVTAPILRDADASNQNPNFTKIPENDFVVGEARGEGGPLSLQGAVTENLTSGKPILFLPVYGFGGMIEGGKFVGQGHFFYASPHIISDSSLCQNNRCLDYGLDVGTYSPAIPEFGFNTHIMQFYTPLDVDFPDLALGQGVVFSVIFMAEIVSGSAPHAFVTGQDLGLILNIPLSWARVEAIDSSRNFDRFTPTLDGRYLGTEALFLPAGNYTIVFSSPFYQSWTFQGVYQVLWSNVYSLVPNPLCPIGATCPSFSPPLAASAGQLGVGFLSTLSLEEDSRAISDCALRVANHASPSPRWAGKQVLNDSCMKQTQPVE